MPGGYDRLQSRFLLTTFGLISSGKGIETVLDALPSIVERHPEALYLIAGRTHPEVARHEGETYRLQLEHRVVDLGLEEHVDFDDRFLSVDELADMLAVTDVFLTPYVGREQIASGALTFAIASGCAAVATPYWYAEDVLSSGAGTIVPFADANAIARAVCEYASKPELLGAAQAEAARIGADLIWSAVAEATAEVLREAVATAEPRSLIRPVDHRLNDVSIEHLHTLVDNVAIVQHAHGTPKSPVK
jgi:glycosyltransferase involved in cell wall biosynthesis